MKMTLILILAIQMTMAIAAKTYGDLSLNELKIMAKGGDAIAELNIGDIYSKKEDLVEAASWYLRAAKKGEINSQFNIGSMYITGEGVQKNIKKSILWFEKAAAQGHKKAIFNLGLIYKENKDVKDIEKSFKWFLKSAENGLGIAQKLVAESYHLGQGVKEDKLLAIYWYKKAMDNNIESARYNLAVMFYNGEGVKKNRETAIQLFTISANNGYEDAILILKKLEAQQKD